MPRGLVIEGVAGTGKSTVLARLRDDPRLLARHPRLHVVTEERTTGELVTELADRARSDEDRCARLRELMPEIRAQVSEGAFVILERFHLTFFALMPRWELVSAIDRELADLSFASVLLDVPDAQLVSRSFHRPEMASAGWEEGLVSWYGSEEKALEAFQRSQEHRRRAIARSAVPTTLLDTSSRDWDRVTDAILAIV